VRLIKHKRFWQREGHLLFGKMGGDDDEDAINALSILGVFMSIVGAATAAGLTMGLMSLDSLDLLVLTESDPEDCTDEQERRELEEEKRHAAVLLPLIDDHHRLLVTLLLLNSVCAEALPIFLDELVPSSVAVLLGVVFLLIFGEIVPSAVFTGPSGMQTSARLSPLVRIFLFVLAPVAIPVGRFLDWWVGDEEEKAYNRSELLALLRLHAGKSAGKLITVRQSKMMQGAMDLMHVTAAEAMTPVDKMFMLSSEAELNLQTMAEIVGKGYSRIPVYEKSNRNRVRGVLLTKTLAVVNPNDHIAVGNLFARPCGCVPPNLPLYDVLAVMKATKSHLCLVTEDPLRLNKIMRKPSKADLKSRVAEPPRLLGCLSLHDIVSCVVATDIGDEYSSRRPRKERAKSTDSASSTDDEGGHTVSTPRMPVVADEGPKIEFKSEFARERVMRWLERARLSAKLHHQVDAAKHAHLEKTETTPLVPSGSGGSVNSQSSADRSAAVARKLLTSWLMKRTSPSGIVRASQVQRTLEHITAGPHSARAELQHQHNRATPMQQQRSTGSGSSAGKRSPLKPPDSDDENVV
jgi:metal transporter CNNM